MRPPTPAAAAPVLRGGAAGAAITVTKVDIGGLPDPKMVENVRVSLSLSDAVGKDVSGRRLVYLLREAEAETREALEPFGYYSPTITIQRSDRGARKARTPNRFAGRDPATADGVTGEAQRAARANRTLSVAIRVELGEPVRIRGFNVGVDGGARATRPCARAGRVRAETRRGARPRPVRGQQVAGQPRAGRAWVFRRRISPRTKCR